MRKRLYRGVVKRACDDPGCDAPWPCERHGQVPTLEQKKSALHGAYLSARQSPALADDSVNWPTANDLDAPACLNCGYVVCACKREEPKLSKTQRALYDALGDEPTKPTLLERVQAFTDIRAPGAIVTRIVHENDGGLVRFECFLNGTTAPGWVDRWALQAFERAQKKPEPGH